jgi:hypothetical protein
MPEGATFWGVALKQTLLGASAFAIGVLLYRAFFYERARHRPFLAVGFVGIATELLLISELILRAPIIAAEWRSLLYLAALLCIAVGFLGDAVRTKHRNNGASG